MHAFILERDANSTFQNCQMVKQHHKHNKSQYVCPLQEMSGAVDQKLGLDGRKGKLGQ
jgi:hypothetical protein